MNALSDGLDGKDADRLLKIAGEETVATGQVILTEGENAGRLLVLESGKVEIQKEISGGQAILGTIRPGDIFGEPGLTGGRRNSVSAVATEDCSLRIFDDQAIVTMVGKYPRLTLNMAKPLSARLRASNDYLKNQIEMQCVVSNKEIARMYSLVQATQTVNSSLEPDRVLELTLQKALRITEAGRCTIYLEAWPRSITTLSVPRTRGTKGTQSPQRKCDCRKNGSFLRGLCVYFAPFAVQSYWVGFSAASLADDAANEIGARIIAGDKIREIMHPMGKGISGYVAETGETVNIPDAYKDKRSNPEFKWYN